MLRTAGPLDLMRERTNNGRRQQVAKLVERVSYIQILKFIADPGLRSNGIYTPNLHTVISHVSIAYTRKKNRDPKLHSFHIQRPERGYIYWNIRQSEPVSKPGDTGKLFSHPFMEQNIPKNARLSTSHSGLP